MKATINAVLAAEPGIAYPPVVNLTWPRGADGYIDVYVWDRDPADPDAARVSLLGAVLTLGLKDADGNAIFARNADPIDAASGHMRVPIAAADTSGLEPGPRRFDLWRAAGDGRVPALKPSVWTVGDAVTLPGDVTGAPAVNPFSPGSVSDLTGLAAFDCASLGRGFAIWVDSEVCYFHIEVGKGYSTADPTRVVAALNLSGGQWVRGLGD
jgi:hypothetical protein